MAKDKSIQNELIELSQAVANLNGKTPFIQPENYFEQFPEKMLQKIESEILIKNEPKLSPLLESLRDKNPFQTPPDYFNEIKVDIPVTNPPVFRLKVKKWMAYAAAACLGGMIFGLVYFSNDQTNLNSLASNAISKEAMESYLMEGDIIDDSNKEIDVSSTGEEILVNLTPATISEMLKDIPDKDISRFLDQNGIEESNTLN